MDSKRLKAILARFSQARVAVLGDFFLDLYIQLDRSLSEFSLETHKEAFQAIDLRGQPGAAGVVTNNLAALGAQTAAIGYTGRDGNGYSLRQTLSKRGVNIEFMIEADDRFTPTYIKPMMREVNGRNIELNRIDIINRAPNPHTLNQALAENIRQVIKTYDGILVVEQVRKEGYGTMSPLLRDILARVSHEYPEKIVMVDSRHFAASYENVSLKMNLLEAAKAVKAIKGDDVVIDESNKLKVSFSYANVLWDALAKPVIITLGDEGISGIADGEFFHIPGFKINSPIDFVGAGDSVLAGIGLALCSGASAQEAAYLGNLVGSITVQQIGTTGIATQEELLERHLEYQRKISE